MQLRNFDSGTFLRQVWQRKPLLVRNPWDSWNNPLEPDELAGLACEPGIESRLVSRSAGRLALEHGPFRAARFGQMAAHPWTLLVQSVDHHVPAVAALLESFRFMPNWRIDDVMVSYAVDGGGVGAHFDNYDVFLVQGLGERRWRVGQKCDSATGLLPHDDLRLLARFEPTDEWVLAPGDILYVPPGIAHDGVALGDDCMTYSIGFRAPSRGELIAGWAAHLIDELDDDDRYTDPGLAVQQNPGEISPQALAHLRQLVAERMLDAEAFAQWFGRYSTAPKNPEIDWRPERPIEAHALRSRAAEGAVLLRSPASRFSFIRGEAGALTLFVDGRSYACSGAAATFAECLCAHPHVRIEREVAVSDVCLGLVLDLLREGSVAFEPSG
jgi:50S ribosomal protein L16 3-hydroxylase